MLNGAVEDGGRIAKISAVIGNTNLRTTHMTVKFDRITGTFLLLLLMKQKRLQVVVQDTITN